MTSKNRFGVKTIAEIEESVEASTSSNTKRSQNSVWLQFQRFCHERKFNLEEPADISQLNLILKDYGHNMKKLDGSEYKETVVKTIWNTTAKLLTEKYFKEFKVKIDPFSGIDFKDARASRDSKRKELQEHAEKRKVSSVALTDLEYVKMINSWDENTPSGLQRRFFLVAARELAWRGGEGAACLTHHFKKELDNSGMPTGRFEYNSIFSQTCQGGAHRLADSKWLIPNVEDPYISPVRLLEKMLSKRGPNIKTDRLFLTENPFWNKPSGTGWFKNSPVGINEIAKWTKESAQKAGLDMKRIKVTNHSTRSAAVTKLAKAGVSEQELIKITGHSNAASIRPYLQIDRPSTSRKYN